MFALVDCNNFYCSCERVFQPELEYKPLIVLSNNDGCAISRTEEAKRLGIPMGAAAHKLKYALWKDDVQVRSSNYTLYDDMSDRVMRTLGRFVQHMEIYSIDEAFLDFSGMERLHKLDALGQRIRATIWQNQSIPVCIGIAPTKTLAKLANHYAKKVCRDVGVYLADTPEKIQDMLDWAPLSEVWGIGKQYGKMLNGHGIHTAAQLLAAPEKFIRQHMTVVGHRMVKELRGISCIPWEYESVKREKKGICSSKSFGKLLTNRKYVENAVARYASRVGEKLRLQKGVTKRVHVFVNTNPYRRDHAQHHQGISIDLLMAASDSPTIVKAALQGLDRIWRDDYWYMKAGVMATEIDKENTIQASLWEPTDKSKINKAMAALDDINHLYGNNTVKIASIGKEEAYEMRRGHLSPCFTTCMDDILVAVD